jgi:cytochrome c oxidase cbb3-type subunit 3
MTRALTSLAVALGWALSTVVPVAATHSLGPMPIVTVISAEYVKGVLAAHQPVTTIDVRRAEDYRVRRLPQARSVPLAELRARYAEIPTTGLVIVYCACHPGEERHAYELLHARGYRNIAMLEGGFSQWIERGYPVEGTTPASRR